MKNISKIANTYQNCPKRIKTTKLATNKSRTSKCPKNKIAKIFPKFLICATDWQYDGANVGGLPPKRPQNQR